MEGQLFKSLSAQYHIESEYIIETEENYRSAFSCTYRLSAVYDETNNSYNYTIDRSDVLIDGKPVRKLMDRLIFDIGNTIYPLLLTVSSHMEITDVTNYDDIKSRWTACTKHLLEKYPSPHMRRYVSMSEKNISEKRAFINSLYQDTFFNVYFRNIFVPTIEDEAKAILWVNFPKREMNQTYLYQINPMTENKVSTSGSVMRIVSDQEGIYTMGYELGGKGDIHNIEGSIESKYQNKLYTKRISVRSENLKTDSHFTENVII